MTVILILLTGLPRVLRTLTMTGALTLPKVPLIFDHRRFKARFMPDDLAVIKLQAWLDELLRQRLELFSRKFSTQAHHDFIGCRVGEYPIEIDPEVLPFKAQSLDLALSAGPLMFTNDIPGVLKQWYAALKPGGVFMATFFGENTLIELKDCFLRAEEALKLPHCLRFFPIIATKDAGMLMQRAGFYLPTADRTSRVFRVDNLRELLKILRVIGGNILHSRSNPLTKEFFNKVESEYFHSYSCQVQLNVTVEIVCMTGWAIERYAEERIQQATPKTIGYL